LSAASADAKSNFIMTRAFAAMKVNLENELFRNCAKKILSVGWSPPQ
jgi:hypothetical protein